MVNGVSFQFKIKSPSLIVFRLIGRKFQECSTEITGTTEYINELEERIIKLREEIEVSSKLYSKF